MPVEFGNSLTTYKPQLRLTYTPNSVEGLSLSARYRLDIKPGQDESRYRHRYTANVGYSLGQWSLGYEGNYYYADNSANHLYDNKRTNYEHNVTAAYKMGAWTPWIELGDINVSDTSDKRELRSRVGIRYSF